MSMKVKPGQYTLDTLLEFLTVRVNARKSFEAINGEIARITTTLMSGGVIRPPMWCITGAPPYSIHVAEQARYLTVEREEKRLLSRINPANLAFIYDNRHLLADLTPHDRLSIVVSKVFTVHFSPYGDGRNYVDDAPFWGRQDSDYVIGYNVVIQRPRPLNSFGLLCKLATEEPQTIDKICQYILRRM